MVLEGARSLLIEDSAPALIIEVHSPENDILLRSRLEALGYTTEELFRPRLRRRPYPTNITAWKESVKGLTSREAFKSLSNPE